MQSFECIIENKSIKEMNYLLMEFWRCFFLSPTLIFTRAVFGSFQNKLTFHHKNFMNNNNNNE